MKHVALSALEAQIIRPGFETHLKPLLRYKGGMGLGRAHRLWNLMVSGMTHEATHSDLTERLAKHPNYSQLCGPPNKVSLMAVRGFVGRLLDHPEVTKEQPHLREYLLDVLPWHKGPLHLTPWKEPPEVFLETATGKSIKWALGEFGVGYDIVRRWFDEAGIDPVREAAFRLPLPKQWHAFAPKENNIELARRFRVSVYTVARWRTDTGAAYLGSRRAPAQSGLIVYPFVIHDGGKPEHALIRKVNAAVPKHLDPETRADICQDLVVGILCGDFAEDDLSLPTKEVTKRVFQMFPTKYGPLSLDEIVPGTDSLRFIDTISNEDSLWERI